MMINNIFYTKFNDAWDNVFCKFFIRSYFPIRGGDSDMALVDSKAGRSFRTRVFKFIFLLNVTRFNEFHRFFFANSCLWGMPNNLLVSTTFSDRWFYNIRCPWG